MSKAALDLFEICNHSFVIRLWLETDAEGKSGATWRGYIVHVPSGNQGAVKQPKDILTFITPYLEPYRMGVMANTKWRIRQWWKQLWNNRN